MISVIIILYNSKEYINKCIKSIEDNFDNKADYELILFNNNSKDDYSGIVKAPYFVENSSKNIGYSKALNYCISKCKGEYILTLNPDTFLYDNAISNLMKLNDVYSKVGVIGAKVLNPNLDFQLSSRRMFPHVSVLITRYLKFIKICKYNKYNYMHIDENIVQEVDSVSGACMLFSKKVYTKIKGFDERFFLYFEDTDFCLRLKKIGYKIIYSPKSTIVHHKGGSISKNNKSFIFFNFYFSMIKFIFKYPIQYKSLFLTLIIIIFIMMKLCQNIY